MKCKQCKILKGPLVVNDPAHPLTHKSVSASLCQSCMALANYSCQKVGPCVVSISNSVSISNHHLHSWILGSDIGTGHMVISSESSCRSFILMDLGQHLPGLSMTVTHSWLTLLLVAEREHSLPALLCFGSCWYRPAGLSFGVICQLF